jgi:hypothetical protein
MLDPAIRMEAKESMRQWTKNHPAEAAVLFAAASHS